MRHESAEANTSFDSIDFITDNHRGSVRLNASVTVILGDGSANSKAALTQVLGAIREKLSAIPSDHPFSQLCFVAGSLCCFGSAQDICLDPWKKKGFSPISAPPPMADEPSPHLARLLESCVLSRGGLDEFAKETSGGISMLLSGKHGTVDSDALGRTSTLRVATKIYPDGTIAVIRTNDHYDLSNRFCSLEERVAVQLSLIRALRKSFSRNARFPLLILGDICEALSSTTRLALRPFLESIGCQVIVVGKIGDIDELTLQPDYVIGRDGIFVTANCDSSQNIDRKD